MTLPVGFHTIINIKIYTVYGWCARGLRIFIAFYTMIIVYGRGIVTITALIQQPGFVLCLAGGGSGSGVPTTNVGVASDSAFVAFYACCVVIA